MSSLDRPSQKTDQPKERSKSEARSGFRRPRRLSSADDIHSLARNDAEDPAGSTRIPFFHDRSDIFDELESADSNLIVKIQETLNGYTGENAKAKKNFFTQQINECLGKGPKADDFRARMVALKTFAIEQLEIDPRDLSGTPEDPSD
jgi:hypothetical protein